jgi:Tfp pilus assembly protein PilZ
VTQDLLTTLGRRTAERICLRVDVGILDEKSGTRILGQLCDLSATGAGVRGPKALSIGEELRLAFEYERGSEPVRLHAEVVWSTRDPRSEAGGYLSGLRFTDLGAPEAIRMREFIERKLATVRQFLGSFELLDGLDEVEKTLLSSVTFERELVVNEVAAFGQAEDTLVLVCAGQLTVVETDREGRDHAPRKIGPGEFCGTLPVDARGTLQFKLRAAEPSSVLCIPSDGFRYLESTHAETALELLACWSLSLRERLLPVDPHY